jgi:hypothetical protein
MEKTKTKGIDIAAELDVANVGEFSNPVALLKLRLQKWTNSNIEKNDLLIKYIRNVGIIEDAFGQIK